MRICVKLSCSQWLKSPSTPPPLSPHNNLVWPTHTGAQFHWLVHKWSILPTLCFLSCSSFRLVKVCRFLMWLVFCWPGILYTYLWLPVSQSVNTIQYRTLPDYASDIWSERCLDKRKKLKKLIPKREFALLQCFFLFNHLHELSDLSDQTLNR